MSTPQAKDDAVAQSELNDGLGTTRVNSRHLNGRIAEREVLFIEGIFPHSYREFFDERGCYEKTESTMTYLGITTIDTRYFSGGKIIEETHICTHA